MWPMFVLIWKLQNTKAHCGFGFWQARVLNTYNCCWKWFAKPSQNHMLDLSIIIDPFTNEAQIKYSRTKFIIRKLFSLPQYIFKYAWMFMKWNIAVEIMLGFDEILCDGARTNGKRNLSTQQLCHMSALILTIHFRDQKVRHTPAHGVACR